jgi:hypothetical protein
MKRNVGKANWFGVVRRKSEQVAVRKGGEDSGGRGTDPFRKRLGPLSKEERKRRKIEHHNAKE